MVKRDFMTFSFGVWYACRQRDIGGEPHTTSLQVNGNRFVTDDMRAPKARAAGARRMGGFYTAARKCRQHSGKKQGVSVAYQGDGDGRIGTKQLFQRVSSSDPGEATTENNDACLYLTGRWRRFVFWPPPGKNEIIHEL